LSCKKILAVIPARGGSKGVPGKNIIDFCGKPLIQYTIEAALNSKDLGECIVSTDSSEIASVAKSLGVLSPFKRPANLSGDEALSLDVVQHAVEFMESKNGSEYDFILMLQPTTPLRQATDIDKAIQLLIETRADSVISVVDVDGHHPLRMKRVVDGRLINYIDQGYEDMRPRQSLPSAYIRNGAIYAVTRDVLMNQHSFTGEDCRAYIMPSSRSINIDTLMDLELAKILKSLT